MQTLPTLPSGAAPDSAAADTASGGFPAATSLPVAVDTLQEAAVMVGTGDFWVGIGWTLAKVALIIVIALLVLGIVKRIKTRWVASVMDEPALDKRRQRVLTVADLLGSVARYAVWTIAVISILEAINLPVGPLLAGAGIAGLAIGFGAQTLFKDVISGFFLLFDDTLGNGDLIRIGPDVGTVEYVGLRLIKVRKFDGELLMVPAGELRTFGNKSIGFARAIVEVGLSYEQDATAALAVLEEVAGEWAASEHARDAMVEEAPQVQALMALGDSAVTARIIVQVRPGEQFQAERDLRALIKQRFDERGVEIPFPRRTVYYKSLDGSAAPAEGAPSGDGAADAEAAPSE